MPPRRSSRRSSRVAWTIATHCCLASATDYFDACRRCRTLTPAWSQAPVGVTTSHQCYASCTGCQSVSALCSRSRGSYISRLVHDWLADDCRLLSDVGRRPLRSNSNDMRKLLVPRTYNKLGDRSFSAAGPRLWNDLPPGLRRPGLTSDCFRQSLKENSFIWRPKRLVTLLNL